MKFRSATEIQDFLDKNLACRKQELTTLRFLILQCRRKHERETLLRASLPLLYAHWEGFIKVSSIAYLKYVSEQRILLKNLNLNFVALACRQEILNAGVSKKVSLHSHIVKYVLEHMDQSIPLTIEGAIDTESNLSSVILKEIMETIGIEFSDLWQKKSFWIDNRLLKTRNGIVHGEMVPLELDTYNQLHEDVIQSLNEYKTEVENAVAQKSFVKVSNDKKEP